MATNTAGTVARQLPFQAINFFRRTITSADAGTTFTLGTLPAGALMLMSISGIQINTVFNGTTPNADIGVTGTTQKWASALDLDAAVAWLPLDVDTAIRTVTVDTPIIVTVTAPSASSGEAEVIVCYIPDIDL